jgi:hypothetical protein
MLKKTCVGLWFLFFFFLFYLLPAAAIQKQHDLNGFALNVAGDCLLIVAIDQNAEIVRLADITCPIHDERALNDAVEFARSMVMNKKIRIQVMSKDRRGHIIDRVYVGERCLNQELLTDGLAQSRLKDSAATRLSSAHPQMANLPDIGVARKI